MNHFRAVVWPRGTVETRAGKQAYRYAIIGMVICDQPLDGIEGQNEIVLDGVAPGIETALEATPIREPHVKTGDATNVMLSLDLL